MGASDRATLTESYIPADTGLPVSEWTVGDALRAAARQWGERLALVAPGPHVDRSQWTFAELQQAAHQVARAILRRFHPGERVAV